MPKANDNKGQLLNLLPELLDDVLLKAGFSRSKESLVYGRIVPECKHELHVRFDTNPSYARETILHLLPTALVRMPKVGEIAIKMGLDERLLGKNSDVVISHQIQNLAPKNTYQRWLVSDSQSFLRCLAEVSDCFTRWTKPFFDEYASPKSLVHQYEIGDDRPIRSHNFFVLIAACYLLLGQRDKAADVLDSHLNKIGLRKIHTHAFQTVAEWK